PRCCMKRRGRKKLRSPLADVDAVALEDRMGPRFVDLDVEEHVAARIEQAHGRSGRALLPSPRLGLKEAGGDLALRDRQLAVDEDALGAEPDLALDPARARVEPPLRKTPHEAADEHAETEDPERKRLRGAEDEAEQDDEGRADDEQPRQGLEGRILLE